MDQISEECQKIICSHGTKEWLSLLESQQPQESPVTLMRTTQVSTVTEEITNLLHQKLCTYRIFQYFPLNSRHVEYLLGQQQLMYVIVVYPFQRAYTVMVYCQKYFRRICVWSRARFNEAQKFNKLGTVCVMGMTDVFSAELLKLLKIVKMMTFALDVPYLAIKMDEKALCSITNSLTV